MGNADDNLIDLQAFNVPTKVPTEAKPHESPYQASPSSSSDRADEEMKSPDKSSEEEPDTSPAKQNNTASVARRQLEALYLAKDGTTAPQPFTIGGGVTQYAQRSQRKSKLAAKAKLATPKR
jgi:hypothetical protein